jgi:hypothetical protein
MRNPRAIAIAMMVLPAPLLGCGKPEGDTGGNAAEPAATPRPVGAAVDLGYVKQVLAATDFDYSQCRRRPDLSNGVSGGVAGEVLILLDSSGSMAARAGAVTRMDEARGAVTTFLVSLPTGTRGGLAVFGDVGDNSVNSKAKSCKAPLHMLYSPGLIDQGRLSQAAGRLRPAGWTPLAAAIRTAAGSFSAPAGKGRTLYVVSDGIESCGGDPVKAARAAKADANVVVNVIGFDVRVAPEVAALREVALAGGGTYQGASSGDLRALMLRELSRDRADNQAGMFNAMYAGHDCTMNAIKRQSTALIGRINADQKAGRINSATALAASRASSDRTMAGMKLDVRSHQQNMRDTDKVNQGIENRMDALGEER